MNHVRSPRDDTPRVSSRPWAPTTATRSTSGKGFQAFISYSHAGEQGLARSIQLALESLGRPLFSLRSMRVFRDQTNLDANPDLWAGIERALDVSQRLILLASPQAAKSAWIPREVAHFVGRHGKERVCIALASGTTPWQSEQAEDEVLQLPECAVTKDVYQCLVKPGKRPLVVNFAPFVAMSHEQRLSSIEFLSAVAQIAGFILNRAPDELVNEHVARQRRVIRLAITVGLLLLGTSGGAAWAAVRERDARADADGQRIEAERQRNVANTERERAEGAEARALEERDSARAAQIRAQREQARADSQRVRAEGAEADAIRERDAARRQALANGSYALAEQDPTIALQMAEMASPDLNATAAAAMLKAFNTGSWLYSHRIDGASDADLSADGRRIAWLDGKGSLHLLDLSTGNRTRVARTGSRIRFLPTGNLVVWSGWNGRGTQGHVTLLGPQGAPLVTHQWEFLDATVCPSGEVIVPAFAGDRRLVVHVMDPRTGGARTLDLPAGVESLGIRSACLSQGGIVVAQEFPSVIAIVDARGASARIDVPNGYHTVDVDVSSRDGRVAVYLAGAVQGVSDAVGWLPGTTTGMEGARLRVAPLPMSPGFDSGGRLRFLPDGRVIAASTDGWTRLLDLETGASSAIERSRATDAIGVPPSGDLIVLARRSGVATVYSSADAVPVGQLRGVNHSDGLNIAFERLAFDGTGKLLLSVARNDVRLWRRPSHTLTVPHGPAFRPFDALPNEALRAFRSLSPQPSSFATCGGTSEIMVDDVGQLSLCIRGGGRTEYLATGLMKGDIAVRGHGQLDGVGHRWIAEEADRIFVLSPELILRLLHEERRRARLWTPDPATIDVWAAGGPRRR
ncbi:TIR domain-containing protein [Longimicrobium sp.]|jgi:hypothetical protein|uniref:TIR domain-containing protein n=1 Tax=Longimicrobium sp. TaxID=2029185 RepID=UPI002F9221E3